MTFHGHQLIQMPASEALRDLLAEAAAAETSAGSPLTYALIAARLSLAVGSVELRASHLLDHAELFRVSEADGGGPEIVESADGTTYVADARFLFEPVVTQLEATDCYFCYEAPGAEVYRHHVVCRGCSYDERGSQGDLITVYELCRDGAHAACAAVAGDEETRPLDLARACVCECHPAEAPAPA